MINAALNLSVITVPDGWTPQRDHEFFASGWDGEVESRHVAALDFVAEGLRRLGATLVMGRHILLGAGEAAHHAAIVHLPLASQVSLLESALNAYPPPDADRFLGAAKACRIAVAESERILMKFATNPEGTTLWELCAAEDLLSEAEWSLVECFGMEYDGFEFRSIASDGACYGKMID